MPPAPGDGKNSGKTRRNVEEQKKNKAQGSKCEGDANMQRMTGQKIRQLLKADKPSIGTWLQLPSPDVAELLGQAGYDWVAADLEHGSFNAETLPNVFRAVERAGAAPFARLPEASRVWIKQALEAGAEGLIFPMIESYGQLEAAIDLATYPGQDFWREKGSAGAYRGVGFCRANGFGQNFAAYREQTARELVLVAQIEHIGAVNELDAILGHPRLDAIMVGPYDLSGSMGLTGQFEHPDFQKAMERITCACHKAGVVMGCHVVEPNPAALAKEIARGSRFIAYGIDTVFLWRGAKRPISGVETCA